MLRFLFIAIFLTIGASPAIAKEYYRSKAVILNFQRIDEPQHTNENISFKQFAAHIAEIKNSEYTILPLKAVINSTQQGLPLNPQTVAITFDASHRSILKDAIPLLIKEEIPFTIFIATELTKVDNHLNWQDIKRISKYKGASFGIYPSDNSLTALPDNEATRLINISRSAFKKHMKREVDLLAYPFGEISNALKHTILRQGFIAGLGQHSGPIHSQSDFLALPRFNITYKYEDPEYFRALIKTTPLLYKDPEPSNWKLSSPINQVGLTITNANNLDNLSCHISGQSKPTVEIIGNRAEILTSEPISGHTDLNCILPTNNDEDKQWQWLGMLFH